MNAFELRPLDIGEILDRAVTLFVRRFAVFVLVLAVVAIPLAVAQVVLQPQTTSMFEDLRRVLAAPPAQRRATIAAVSVILAHNRTGPGLGVLIVLGLLFGALSSIAVKIAIGDAYAGRMPSVRDAYRRAGPRWFPQLIVGLLYAAVFAILTIGIVLMLAIAIALSGLLAAKVAWLGIALAVIVAIVSIAAIVLGYGLWYFAFGISSVSIALEAANPIRALEMGVRRTLAPSVLWRSMLVAITVAAVVILGQTILVALGGTLVALTRQVAFAPIVTVIGSLLLNALIQTFIVIYAIDVRVRREGYDLLLDAAGERAERVS